MDCKSKLAVTGVLAGAFALGACTNSPYEEQSVTVPKENADFKVKTLAVGAFIRTLPNGVHKLTISEKITGRETDMECVVITDGVGRRGFAAMDCDF